MQALREGDESAAAATLDRHPGLVKGLNLLHKKNALHIAGAELALLKPSHRLTQLKHRARTARNSRAGTNAVAAAASVSCATVVEEGQLAVLAAVVEAALCAGTEGGADAGESLQELLNGQV